VNVKKPKIAFVVQRCGVEVNGGAEALCLAAAQALSRIWDVHIITTCARDYATWEDYYAPGLDSIGNVTVHRFPVDQKRNPRIFDDLSQRIISRLDSADVREQERWMREQGPYSTPLLEHISASADEYDVFFFFTYLYATTYFGLALVREKSVLVPFAHDEWPIWLNFFEPFFERVPRFVFSTPEERAFLHRRFPRASLTGTQIGVGIEYPDEPNPERFRSRYGVTNSYVVYVGRIDESKNCRGLIEYFDHFKERIDREGSDLILLLLGREAMDIPKRPWMRHLGFVDEQTKWDAIAGARALIMPSHLESLSLVLLESWRVGRPVLVNAASEVLVGQCRRAQGGLWFTDRDEFGIGLLHLIYGVGDQLGAAGRAFVAEHYTWEQTVREYEDVRTAMLAHRSADVDGAIGGQVDDAGPLDGVEIS
jgi:glycosyltransferase involved in cell wall biosynthesis